ncbi:ankyrin repeat domain-containing protein [bacterium]|nr:ankyrin repeat domain-containing protein [bacterium]
MDEAAAQRMLAESRTKELTAPYIKDLGQRKKFIETIRDVGARSRAKTALSLELPPQQRQEYIQGIQDETQRSRAMRSMAKTMTDIPKRKSYIARIPKDQERADAMRQFREDSRREIHEIISGIVPGSEEAIRTYQVVRDLDLRCLTRDALRQTGMEEKEIDSTVEELMPGIVASVGETTGNAKKEIVQKNVRFAMQLKRKAIRYGKILEACARHARETGLSQENLSDMTEFLMDVITQQDLADETRLMAKIRQNYDAAWRAIRQTRTRNQKIKNLLEDIVFRLGQVSGKRLDSVLQKYPNMINWLFRRAVEKKDYRAIVGLASGDRIDWTSKDVAEALNEARKYEVSFLKKAVDGRDLLTRLLVFSDFKRGNRYFDESALLKLFKDPASLVSLFAEICRDNSAAAKHFIRMFEKLPPPDLRKVDDEDLVRAVGCSEEFLGGTMGRVLMERITGRLGEGAPLEEIMGLIPDASLRAFRDAAGQTPFHAAIVADRPDVVRALLDRGVPVDIPDATGHIPLHTALISERQNLKIIVMLIRAIRDRQTIFTILLKSLLELRDDMNRRSNVLGLIEHMADEFVRPAEVFTDAVYKLMDTVVRQLGLLKDSFLPLYALADRGGKVKSLIRGGARCEPVGTQKMRDMMAEEMEKVAKKKRQQQRIKDEARMDLEELAIFGQEVLELERTVAAELGFYDAVALGFGAEPTIRVEALPEDEFSAHELESLESADERLKAMYTDYTARGEALEEMRTTLRSSIPEQLRSADAVLSQDEIDHLKKSRKKAYKKYEKMLSELREMLYGIRESLPPVYRVVAMRPDVPLYRDEKGVLTRLLQDDEAKRLPPEILEQHRRKKIWHAIVASAREEVLMGSRSRADYAEFLRDIINGLDILRRTTQSLQRKTMIPIRWTDSESVVGRRSVWFKAIRPLIGVLYQGFQKGTTVFAVDTINVLRGRDKTLRETDYTDANFQAVLDTAFDAHAEDIAGVLEAGTERTTIVWVYPRVGQETGIVVRPVPGERKNHRRVFVDIAVRRDDLPYTRSLDDFFLLCLVSFYKSAKDEKIRGTRLVVVSEDKFRDWSEDVIGYDAAWEPRVEAGQRVQKRAKRMAR